MYCDQNLVRLNVIIIMKRPMKIEQIIFDLVQLRAKKNLQKDIENYKMMARQAMVKVRTYSHTFAVFVDESSHPKLTIMVMEIETTIEELADFLQNSGYRRVRNILIDADFYWTTSIRTTTRAELKNIALHKSVFMKTAYIIYPGSHAVDGNLNTMAHTTNGENWMIVDLADEYRIHYVVVHNRADAYFDSLDYFSVGLLESYEEGEPEKNELCGRYPYTTPAGVAARLNCTLSKTKYRYVTLFANEEKSTISIMEFEIYGTSKTNFMDQHIGCYKTLSGREVHVGSFTFVYECQDMCSSYLYMAIRKADECYCDGSLGQVSTLASCDLECAFDDSSCGSNDNFSVYLRRKRSNLNTTVMFGRPEKSSACSDEFYEQIAEDPTSTDYTSKQTFYDRTTNNCVAAETPYTGLQNNSYIDIHS
ncbi:hypothetical protein HELRODRAFT_193237 [Helobdella robusta]|uniref:WSC domain-containing protein n=1 Tax=Helobdella robusta TaxID=6412 RepID=T1FUS1_HELRO|nr:hypothetical protein HELRODRAFT_193237 [Helobdella robusta]ESN97543.1 hypothetical protein HELRODRAFT_193237 [Helobdella robusta]